MKQLIITGIRGVPASHGGFETFAENLSIYLVKQGWKVTVYCQEAVDTFSGAPESLWQGVRRVHIPVKGMGAKATIMFDYLSIKHAANEPGLVLTLGYNTALFNVWLRIKGKRNIINMDGIEWKRDKWTWYEKTWLYLNERAGCLIGNHLIADHPEIKNHLISRVTEDKVTMIPYGARAVESADISLLYPYGVKEKSYALVIARPEPENSILEIVQAFSEVKRGYDLVVLGRYEPSNSYHVKVLGAASEEVKFVGSVYDHAILDALRFFSRLYIHGHTVGGTNPSLIEALGSGQAILAHNNKFNRWVVGEEAGVYFTNSHECGVYLNELLSDSSKLEEMSLASARKFYECFTWASILKQYEDVLLKWA